MRVLFGGLWFSVDFCLFFSAFFLSYSWRKIRRHFCSYCWWIRLWKKITQIEAETLKPTGSCADPKLTSVRCKTLYRQQSRTCGYGNSADRDLGVPLLATPWYILPLELSFSEVWDTSITCFPLKKFLALHSTRDRKWWPMLPPGSDRANEKLH